jgi:AcrR family transcriptional regulator
MPGTRRTIDRAEKVDEILDVAEHRLREGGETALSVAGIARELGVAPNAVYWYFPSRDHLFVAAMQRMLGRIVARKPKAGSWRDRILWFVEQLHDLYPLRAAMHERAAESEVIAEFERQMNDVLRSMLTNTLQPHVRKDRLGLAVDTFVSTVQGSFLQEMSPAQRRRMLSYTLEQITRR